MLKCIFCKQYAAVPEHIKVGGSSIYSGKDKLTVDQALVCFSDLNGLDRSAVYLKYRKGYRKSISSNATTATQGISLQNLYRERMRRDVALFPFAIHHFP